MNKKVLILILFYFLTFTVVSAEDSNISVESDFVSVEMNQDVDDNLNLNDEINQKTDDKEEVTLNEAKNTSDEAGDDCCTSIIQGYNNDSALSFRRDSETNIKINVIHNSTIIKQSKASGTYFFHVLISKDGWFVGNGGMDDGEVSHAVEDIALKMISNKKINTTNFNQIIQLKSKASMGHFIIKAPNGTYMLMTRYKKNSYKESGVLKAGDYIVLPNSPNYFHKGNYVKYTGISSIMLASRKLNALDDYASQRHNIITYYYNPSAYSTVKITASNDDGRYIGKNSANYVDSIQTNTKLISSKIIPVLDKWIDVDEVYLTYKKMKTDAKINDLISNENKVSLKAYVYDQFGNPVNEGQVSFSINNNTVTNTVGNTTYYDVKNGIATFTYTVNNLLQKINYTYSAKYIGNSKYYEGKSNSSQISFDIINIKTKHDTTAFCNGNLTISTNISYKKNGTHVSDGYVYYMINDVVMKNSLKNNIKINPMNGTTRFNLNFNENYKPGTYNISVVYTNGFDSIQTDTSVTLIDSDKKINLFTEGYLSYSDVAILTAKVYDMKGNAVNEGKISFVVDNRNLINSKGNIILFDVKNGTVSFNYRVPNIWNRLNINYSAVYYGTNRYDGAVSDSSVIIFDPVNVETRHDSNIFFNGNLTITTHIYYKNNDTQVTGGYVYYMINGVVIKNSLKNIIKINVLNGTTRFNLKFNENYKPGTYNVTTVYTNGLYTTQRDTKVNIKGTDRNVSLLTEGYISYDDVAVLKVTAYDMYGNAVNEGKISFVVDNRNLINSKGNIILFDVKNGTVSFNYRVPDIWNRLNISYSAVYYGTEQYDDAVSNSSLIIFDSVNVETRHDSNIFFNGNLTITTHFSYKNNDTQVTGGYVYYIINGVVIKNSLKNIIKINVLNGSTKFNLKFNENYKPGTYNITTVYTNGLYIKETESIITINED